MIAEDGQLDGALEYPFHFFEELPTVQEMASYRICQTIWHTNIKTADIPLLRFFDNADLKRLPRVDALVEDFHLPKPIEETLKRNAKKAHDELKVWTEYMSKISPFHNVRTLEVDIDWCIWSPNGDIDYRKSAAKALNSGSLNDEDKFVILSKFCMEDELKSSSSRTLLEAVENVRFGVGTLEFYWVCYLKNELERMHLDEGSTLEKTMADHCCAYARTPPRCDVYCLEYFWHRMGNDDRVSFAVKILRNKFWSGDWAILERLIRSICFSNTQSLAVLSALYLRRFMYHSPRSQHHLPIWHRFKNQIADKDYGCIIVSLVMNLLTSEDRMRMVLHIWDTAHDHHRQYVAAHRLKDIIEFFTRHANSDFIRYPNGCFKQIEPPCSAANDLLWRIILQLPEIERSKLIKQHVNVLVGTIESLETMRKTLHLCLASTNEQSQFKNTLSQSTKLQSTCVSFLVRSKYAELNANLEWLFSDRGPSALNDYKKLILSSITWKYTSSVETFISSVARWSELSQFIDEAYAEDVQSAYEMKQMLVERATSVIPYGRNFRQYFDIARQIIEQVLPVQELAYFKRIRLHGLGDQLQSGVYWNNEQAGDEIFQNFVEWCCDHDEESITKFKKSIPFRALLNRILFNVVHFHLRTELNLESLLHRFDKYLKWFVGGDEKVRECKLQAVEYCAIYAEVMRMPKISVDLPLPMQLPFHMQLEMLRRIEWPRLTQVTGEEREMLLSWLCDTDEAALRRFNEMLGDR